MGYGPAEFQPGPGISITAMSENILIVDFGSQVTQLIARRVRESGVYCEIHPFQKVDEALIKAFAPKGVILSGGPASVTEMDTPRAPDGLFEMGVPVLGICYGEQTMVTPNLDKLASQGRRFDRHYVAVPTCGASRFALLTGTYGPSGNGALFEFASRIARDPQARPPSMPSVTL